MAQMLELIPTRIPAVQVAEDGRRIWDVRLLGRDQEDIDVFDPTLLGCDPRPAEAFRDGVANGAADAMVKLVARDEISRCPSTAPKFETEGRILTPADGKYEEGATIVRFVIEPSDTMCHGIYEAQIGLFAGRDTDSSRAKLLYTWPVFVEIEPNLFHAQVDRGGLSVWWVKSSIRDLVASDESLLDEVEFANYEVLQAVRRAVDSFNTALPNIHQKYTTNTFQWREPLLDGVVWKLYEAAAKLYLRDHLAYAAGGTSIDDKNKYQQYQAFAQMHEKRYMEWVVTKKRELNEQTFWGVVG